MNRLARWIMRLYPAQWRARYGEEVDALLSDTGADARTVADLARGGVRMQFSSWSFLKLTVTLGLVGILLGAAISVLLPSQYTSKATMAVTAPRDATTQTTTISSPLNEYVQRLLIQVDSQASLTPILRKLNLYPDPTLDDAVEHMRNNIHVNFVNAPTKFIGSAAFDIAFTYPERYKTQQTVLALMTAFQQANVAAGVQYNRAASQPGGSLMVLDEANLPDRPFYSSKVLGLLGSLLGEMIPHQYRSEATLRLVHGTSEQVLALTNRVTSPAYLSSVVNDPRLMLYRDQRSKAPDEIIQLMKENLSVSFQRNYEGPAFTVAFEYKDRYKARQTVESLVSQFERADAEMFPVSPRSWMEPPAIMDVLDTASLPSTPSKPNRPVIVLACGIFGFILGALISIVRRLWTPPAIAPLNAVNG